MPHIPKRPPSLEHLSDERAARSLSKHFGNIVEAAKELAVDRRDLRRLIWHNPRILDAAHERMELFLDHTWGEAVCGLDSRRASVRQRAADRIFAHPRAIGSSVRWLFGGVRARAACSRSSRFQYFRRS